jgi:hypothetical protein
MTHRFKLAVLLAAVFTPLFTIAQAPADQAQAAAVVPADQQPSDSQLTRLFEVMRVKEQMATTTKMMPQLMQQAFGQQVQELQKTHPELANLTPEQKQKFNQVMGAFMQQAMNLYTADDVLSDLKGVYKKHLTQSDVENLITFYNSTSGQHMLDMVPAMMQEFMPIVMHKTQERMKPLLAQMEKDLAGITNTPNGGKPDQPK